MTVELAIERDELLRRFRAKDPADNGRFLVGVLTTGIYCLPTCRARSPRPENVRFFPGEDAARKAGLRPCKRCRPDHFYRRFDPDRERLRALAAAVRAAPAEFADAGALSARAGIGATKLHALFRRHYQLTPADFLARERVRAARALLAEERASVLDAAAGSGFESASAFHENFRALTGMTPASYRELGRELGRESVFRVALPARFRPDELLAFFGRDPGGSTERARNRKLVKALLLEGVPARVELELDREAATVRVAAARALPRTAWTALHERVVRWLGLESDAAGFERRAARSREVARLVRGREGLRIPRSTDAFEGLVWVIVGAQVNVAFASACRAALIRRAGTPAGDGMTAHPAPADVARLEPYDLVELQFSRRKAEYLVDAARAVVSGELDLEGLRLEPATLVQERLAAVRGLGPWSVQYLCLRSFGFEDCAPAGDVALAEALKRFDGLDERPDPSDVARRMERFAPHRSLASYHLWKTLPS